MGEADAKDTNSDILIIEVSVSEAEAQIVCRPLPGTGKLSSLEI